MSSLTDALQRVGIDPSKLGAVPAIQGDSIHAIKTDGKEALALWRRLLDALQPIGFRPVIISNRGGLLENLEDTIDDADRPAETLAAAAEIELPSWFSDQAERALDEGHDEPRGDWPLQAESSREILGLRDHQGRWRTAVEIWILPAKNGWEIPALLQLGAWNDCPAPEVHVAVMRYWHERYGAELVLVDQSTFEFTVSRPPMTRDAAIALAKEQYAYCYDIVEQGVETIDALAAILLQGRTWFFWWD